MLIFESERLLKILFHVSTKIKSFCDRHTRCTHFRRVFFSESRRVISQTDIGNTDIQVSMQY